MPKTKSKKSGSGKQEDEGKFGNGIFLALENPLSKIGIKEQNFPPSDRRKGKEKEEKAKQHQTVKDIFESQGYATQHDGAFNSDRELIQNFVNRHGNARMAVAGSLRTLFKRLEGHCEEDAKLSFDTLIFLGHGGVGTMSVGMGDVGDLRPPAPGSQPSTAFAALKVEKRELNEYNKDVWKLEFSGISHRLIEQDTGKLFIFLLGCNTANSNANSRSITAILAETLSIQLSRPVTVFGATIEMKTKHTKAVLDNLDKIKGEVGRSGEGSLDLAKYSYEGIDGSLEYVTGVPR